MGTLPVPDTNESMLSQNHAGLSDPDQLLLQDLSDRSAADRGECGEAAGAIMEGVVRQCFAKASDDARAEKGSGRTDVRPLGSTTKQGSLAFRFRFLHLLLRHNATPLSCP